VDVAKALLNSGLGGRAQHLFLVAQIGQVVERVVQTIFWKSVYELMNTS
jgi:hypothetical protein